MATSYYVHEGSILTGVAAVVGDPAGALATRVITSAALVNTTGAAIPATVYLVPSAGAPAVANCLISARTIAPGETYFCPELINQGLRAGGSVQALGAGLTFRYAARDIF